MNIKKIVGWVLTAVGLLVIAQAVNLSYQYFSAKQDFPAVFKAPKANLSTEAQTAPAANQAVQIDAQAEMQIAVGQAANEAISAMLPQDAITKLLNAIVWSLFAAFLVYAGAQIAGLGIKMMG